MEHLKHQVYLTAPHLLPVILNFYQNRLAVFTVLLQAVHTVLPFLLTAHHFRLIQLVILMDLQLLHRTKFQSPATLSRFHQTHRTEVSKHLNDKLKIYELKKLKKKIY